MTSRTNTDRQTPPDFLTIEEAAVVLRIGRSAAYRLARIYMATDGAEGLPVGRFGKQLRVPRCKLEVLLGGPITWPLPEKSTSPRTVPAKRQRRRSTSRSVRSQSSPQLFSV